VRDTDESPSVEAFARKRLVGTIIDRGDDFVPSTVTDRPETIQAEKPAADGIENFSLSSIREAKPKTPKQTPGYNEYIALENSIPLPLTMMSVQGQIREGNTYHLV
jgi:hypothetical protein